VLTRLRIRNFKRLENVEIELGSTVVFVGPNNSGKTSALQALALLEAGLRKWLEKRGGKGAPEKRPGVTINRRDLISVPVPDANLLWSDLHVREIKRSGSGKQETRNIRIDIEVSGVTNDKEWNCGFEFDYANAESFYCRPMRAGSDSGAQRMIVPDEAEDIRVAFLPPMSGMAATEDRLPEGAINVRIGEGRTAEVLRNLCLQISASAENPGSWSKLVEQMRQLFGVELNRPAFVKERGQITMTYADGEVELDLVSSGRGLQQTLLLLAHLYTHPGSVLLLDEPDAHLEILRQRQIYQLLTDTAKAQGCQVVVATHSEVLLNEAADRDMVVAFVGKPHRIDDRGSQVSKSLKTIGFEHYYQAEQTGWVLYLEGSTDLAILRGFAETLNHPAKDLLTKPFVHYVGNSASKSREHFHGLREAKQDLVGLAIYDQDEDGSSNGTALIECHWKQREIENYLCFRETLLAYSDTVEGNPGPLFEPGLRENQRRAMEEAIRDVSSALQTLEKPDPFGANIKASDEFLTPVFAKYFQKLRIRNLMQKTDFHVLVPFVPREKVEPEIVEKLDLIVSTANRAHPA